jgi:hypothetical protein
MKFYASALTPYFQLSNNGLKRAQRVAEEAALLGPSITGL